MAGGGRERENGGEREREKEREEGSVWKRRRKKKKTDPDLHLTPFRLKSLQRFKNRYNVSLKYCSFRINRYNGFKSLRNDLALTRNSQFAF